ncbi:hypothetical protein [Phormidesmis priestleyi]
MKPVLLLLLSAISLVTAIPPAQAANYRSTNGTTIIDLSEIGNSNLTALPRNIGFYHTLIKGQRVQGTIQILTRNAAPNNAKYNGTFDETPGCKGTIALDRTILVGGRSCPESGVDDRAEQ